MQTEHNKLVREFMSLFKQQLPKAFADCNDNVASGRFKMLEEEYKEWQRAKPLDYELFDAYVDILYIAHGSLLALGVKLKELPILANHIQLTGRKMALDHNMAMALSALQKRPLCPDRLQTDLSNLIQATYIAALSNGLDIDAAFCGIHVANMNKLWNADEMQHATSKNTVKVNTPDGVRWIVYNDYGKVIKPPSWKEFDLRPLVIKALRRFEGTVNPAPAVASNPPESRPADRAQTAPAPSAPLAKLIKIHKS